MSYISHNYIYISQRMKYINLIAVLFKADCSLGITYSTNRLYCNFIAFQFWRYLMYFSGIILLSYYIVFALFINLWKIY
jgi:hypothetical protein